MTPEEAIKRLCNQCEKYISKNGQRCPWRSISGDYCEEVETLQKAVARKNALEKWVEYEKGQKECNG